MEGGSVYKLGRLRNKYIILELLSYTYSKSRVLDLLYNSNKKLRKLLKTNMQAFVNIVKDDPEPFSDIKCILDENLKGKTFEPEKVMLVKDRFFIF